MNSFQLNLLNVLHFFKNAHDDLPTDQSPAVSSLDDLGLDTRKQEILQFNFYDFMSPLLSIYLDVNLMIKARSRLFKVIEFKTKKLKKFLCLNLFYLVDSCVYYACNTVLRMKSLNSNNFEYILPIIR